MGRIKTSFIKRIGKELFEENSDKFSDDFSKNKEVLKTLVKIKSKKLMNVLAGYVTSLKKQEGS